MRIGNLTLEDVDGVRRASADVVFEDARRPARRIFFEAPGAGAEDLRADPHAFLLAAAIPALRAGEARVHVEGRLCPQLRDGLAKALQRLSGWNGSGSRVPRIEAADGFASPAPASPRRAIFLSGGVDSLALLHREWQSRRPPDPESVRDAICVEGFDLHAWRGVDPRPLYERTLASLAPVAAETGVELLPLRTNLRCLDDGNAWLHQWLAAGTAATAHALSRRFDRVSISASFHRTDAVPLGTHPDLDPLYSSAALAVRHDGAEDRRIEKAARIAGWETGLRALRVCLDIEALPGEERLNCGRCHKCVITMLELLCAGALKACPAFAPEDVTPEMTNVLRPTRTSSVGFYREMIEPLRARGRDDLANALLHKIAVHGEFTRRRASPWQRLRGQSYTDLSRWAFRRARVDSRGAPAEG